MRGFLYLLSALFIAAIGFAAASFYAFHTPRPYAEQTIIIAPHTGGRTTLAQLHEAGLTPSLPFMLLPMLQAHQFGALKAGEYQLTPGLSPAEIIAKIVRGEVVVHKLTIPEGWTSFQVRAALVAEPLLSGDVPEVISEGSVRTDTIHFTRGETRSAVLIRMQQAQTAMLDGLWAQRAPEVPLRSADEALVLASVVEKETGVPDERAKVAGVFYNRLRLGMMLQSDPTVAYGVEVAQGGAPLGRPLSKADLLTDTPYNSYTRTGLPPGPICNPGRATIEAVLHPEATDALYFVATGHGGHNFAVSIDAHAKNVADYRKAVALPGKSDKRKVGKQ
jgi:UPF0755 protein